MLMHNRNMEYRVQVQGGHLYAKSWSPSVEKDPTPLILLHDSLGCVLLWRDFPAQLSEQLGRRVLANDRLGFSQSSERNELPSFRFVEEEAEIYLPALLREAGIHQFDLFGHSVGGAMAIAIAAKVPGCRSVITESAQAFVESRTIEGILKAKEDFKDAQTFNRLMKYHGLKASWGLRAWTDVWLSPQFANWSLEPLLPHVKCPVLAIHGDSDEYGSIAFPQMIQSLTGGPSQMSVVEDCGHVPHREKPEMILNLIQDFYQTHFSVSSWD